MWKGSSPEQIYMPKCTYSATYWQQEVTLQPVWPRCTKLLLPMYHPKMHKKAGVCAMSAHLWPITGSSCRIKWMDFSFWLCNLKAMKIKSYAICHFSSMCVSMAWCQILMIRHETKLSSALNTSTWRNFHSVSLATYWQQELSPLWQKIIWFSWYFLSMVHTSCIGTQHIISGRCLLPPIANFFTILLLISVLLTCDSCLYILSISL